MKGGVAKQAGIVLAEWVIWQSMKWVGSHPPPELWLPPSQPAGPHWLKVTIHSQTIKCLNNTAWPCTHSLIQPHPGIDTFFWNRLLKGEGRTPHLKLHTQHVCAKLNLHKARLPLSNQHQPWSLKKMSLKGAAKMADNRWHLFHCVQQTKQIYSVSITCWQSDHLPSSWL